MTTRREMGQREARDIRELRRTWHRLFNSGDDLFNRGMALQDMTHLPSGLRQVLDEVFEEGIDSINEYLETLDIKDVAEAYDEATNKILCLARFIAARFYRMGQELHQTLPYKDLTPCPCSALADDELEDFLKEAATVLEGESMLSPLVGDGWIIQQYDRRKKKKP